MRDERPLKVFSRRSTCFKISLIVSGRMDFMGCGLEEGRVVRYLVIVWVKNGGLN